jgi:hypothetical protein
MPLRSERAAFAAVVLVGYLALGRVVLNAYPVSVFDMYATPVRPHVSRLVVDADGERSDPQGWVGWTCDGLDPADADRGGIPYLRADRAAAFEAQGDGPTEDVALLRVTWTAEDGLWTKQVERLASCRAQRR